MKPFNKVQEYRELVCSYLASDVQNTPYPNFWALPMLGSRAQMACLAPSVPSSNPVFVAGKKARNRPCHLCMAEGHWASQCVLYFGDQPGEDKCPKCGGLHTRPCREDERAQVIQPVFARYRKRTENWIRQREEETETETEPEAAPEAQQPQQHHQPEDQRLLPLAGKDTRPRSAQHQPEPPPPYWPGDGPRPRQRIEQWDRQQEEPRQAPQKRREHKKRSCVSNGSVKNVTVR